MADRLLLEGGAGALLLEGGAGALLLEAATGGGPSTVNNSASVASATPGTTLETASFAVGGSNRVLYVLAGSGASSPSDVSAVKWGGSGGTSLTQLGTTATVATNMKVSLWRLIAPTAQTSTVHATWSGTDDERWLVCVAVQDADQTTPNGTVATATGGSDLIPTVNATSVSGDLVLDFMSWLDLSGSSKTCSVGAGQTSLQNIGAAAISPYEGAGASWETAAGTSTTMSWSVSATGIGLVNWYTFALAVNGVAGGGGQSAAVGRADETDSASALARRKSKATGLATETDAASALARRKARAAGLATTTETASALGRVKSKPVGLATETDSALALARGGMIVPTGLATETDTASALARVKSRGAQLATETSQAFSLARVKSRPVGLAIETDQAFALAGGGGPAETLIPEWIALHRRRGRR